MARFWQQFWLAAAAAAVLTGGLASPALADRHKDKDKAERCAKCEKHDKRDRDKGDEKKGHRGHGKDHDKKKHHRMMRMLFKGVDLSEKQHAALREIHKAHRKRRHAFWKEHGEEMRELWEEAREARREGEKDELKEVREEMHELFADAPWKQAVAAVRDELDDKQTAQFNENLKALKGKMKRRFHPRWDGGDDRGEKRRPDRKKHHGKKTDSKKHRMKDRDRDGHKAGHRGRMIRHLLKDVDLYDEQAKEIRQLVHKAREKRAKRGKHAKKMHHVRRAIHEARKNRDHAKIAELHEKLAEMHRQAAKRHDKRDGEKGDLLGKIRHKLTEEQQAQLKENLKELRKKRGHQHKKDDDKDGKDRR
jgi:Spy/CpxP family protein refolding chaperone